MTREAYYPGFDWLRAVLAGVVMLYHDKLLPWSHSGNLAVQVFFALSGWLIGSILLNTQSAGLPRFFFNRAVRIWAPYFLALGLVLAASLLREPVTAHWLEFVAYKATFVYNLFGATQLPDAAKAMPLWGTANHFWSVNAEEQFYLLAPLLLVLAPWGRSVPLWSAIALAAWLTDTYAAIVFGVLAAIVVRERPDLHLRHCPLILVMGVASAAALPFAYRLAAAPFSVCVVLLLARTGERSEFGALMGGMSYPLYLNHWIGVFVGNALLGPFGMKDSPLRVVLAVVLNVSLAIALYLLVDRQLLARRGALFTAERGLVAMLAGYGLACTGLAFGLSGGTAAALVAGCFCGLLVARRFATAPALRP